MRGDRKKQEEREKGKEVGEAEENGKIIDIRNYKPKRIPMLMWRECIKKVWEVAPLLCPKCPGEISVFKVVLKNILKTTEIGSVGKN